MAAHSLERGQRILGNVRLRPFERHWCGHFDENGVLTHVQYVSNIAYTEVHICLEGNYIRNDGHVWDMAILEVGDCRYTSDEKWLEELAHFPSSRNYEIIKDVVLLEEDEVRKYVDSFYEKHDRSRNNPFRHDKDGVYKMLHLEKKKQEVKSINNEETTEK